MQYTLESIFRWLLIPISAALQLIVYVIYPFLCAYMYIKKYYTKTLLIPKPSGDLNTLVDKWKLDPIRDQWYTAYNNNQTALLDCFLWSFDPSKAEHGMEALVTPEGSLYRSAPTSSMDVISGDCLSSWSFAYVLSGIKRPDLVMKVAFHYLKSCFGLKALIGYVGNRSSNNGVNYVYDGYYKMNQPAFAPQFYTSAAIFALAASEAPWYLKPFWHLVYAFNFVVFGGWIYTLLPFWHPPSDDIYYAQEITALNAYVCGKVRTFNWSYRWSLNRLSKLCVPNCNPLFYALYIDLGGSVNQTDWKLAKDTLLTLKGANDFTFQHTPSPDWLTQGESEIYYSPLSFVAKLLLNNQPK